jgi:hypothetical protein
LDAINPQTVRLRSPLSTVPAGIIVPTFPAALTTVAFDQSGPRWFGDVIAEPEGPTFISYKVARNRLDRLRFVTQDPEADINGTDPSSN